MRGAGVITYCYTVCWAELMLMPSERQKYLRGHQTKEKKNRWTERESH